MTASHDHTSLSPALPASSISSARLGAVSPHSPAAISPAVRADLDSDDDDDDDDDDEFFEAIETGAIAVEPMTVSRASLDTTRFSELDVSCLTEGYEVKRTTLPIKADDRPSVSLWGILKNSIGKDLTKISFPVSFNEPTSMLQRMAEDMQFSECCKFLTTTVSFPRFLVDVSLLSSLLLLIVDAASENEDSLIRLAYVAGFAMSNYASTVGRLSK